MESSLGLENGDIGLRLDLNLLTFAAFSAVMMSAIVQCTSLGTKVSCPEN